MTPLNWSDANYFCQNLITPNDRANNVITHLLSIDSLTESVIVNFFLKNNNNNISYWIDGQALNTDNRLKKWSWSNRALYSFGYLKDSFDGQQNVYLWLNSSSEYELSDDNANITLGFICEAQGN